ncbi:hypothetical protein A2U01_0113087, partial [Trifolium medium]|nr:hypothetical protein [Trifolium medium]
SRPATAGDRK